MDETTIRLLEKRRKLEMEQIRIARDLSAIDTALKLAGIKPEPEKVDLKEALYRARRPFADTTLAEACRRILRDYKNRWLTKSQVEYLIMEGGYKFSTSNPKNSVDITLRRLASQKECEVQRARGSHGNKYHYSEGIGLFPPSE